MKYFVSESHLPVAKDRAGLSLFEILTAMFVLMVGLLGVLAVLPFGMYQMNRVNKADFGGNCGRAAIRDIQVRNWANDFNDSLHDPYETDRMVYNPNLDLLLCDRPLIVDPLLLDGNGWANDGNLKFFPSVTKDGHGLPRLTCMLPARPTGEWAQKTAMEWRKNQVDSAFYWKDDRNFAAPASPIVQVPRPVGVTTDNVVQSHENYSWLYMLTPQTRGQRFDATGNTSSVGAYSRQQDVVGYDVDVVVFFNRKTRLTDLPLTERSVIATRARSSDLRGGEFTLQATSVEALDMQDTRWILLSCADNSMIFAKWYRVVNVSEIIPDGVNYTRKIMLLGPDVPNAAGYSATLLQGAIHVYSSVVIKN